MPGVALAWKERGAVQTQGGELPAQLLDLEEGAHAQCWWDLG